MLDTPKPMGFHEWRSWFLNMNFLGVDSAHYLLILLTLLDLQTQEAAKRYFTAMWRCDFTPDKADLYIRSIMDSTGPPRP
jgi:hypothetical protein